MAYVKKFEYSHYDFYDTIHYRVELLQDGAGAGSTSIQNGTIDPTHLKTNKISRSGLDIVYGSEFTFSFVVDRDDISDYDDLFESVYKEWRLDFYKDEVLDWRGYIQSDAIQRTITGNVIVIEIAATDALKDLSKEEFRYNGQIITGKSLSILTIVRRALEPLGIDLPFQVKLGTWETTYGAADSNCLHTTFVYVDRFARSVSGKTEVDSCLTVIEAVLKDFNVVLRQIHGCYRIGAKHEGNSYYYQYTWALNLQGRYSSTGDVVDTTSWKLEGEPTMSLISPLQRVEITHRNRNMGSSLVEDLDDWTTGPWDIQFDSYYTEDSGDTLVLLDDYNFSHNRILTLTDDFSLTKVTDSDYVRVNLSFQIRGKDSDYLTNRNHSVVRIYIVNNEDSSLLAATTNLTPSWGTMETSNIDATLITASGDFNIEIEFETFGLGDYACEFLIKDVNITKVTVADEGEIISDISFDEFTQVQSDTEGREIVEVETLFGDTGQDGDLGAFYVSGGGTENSTFWRRYGKPTEAIPIIESYGLCLLTDRQRYKEFISGLNYHDVNDILRLHNWIAINRDSTTRYYRIQAFDKSFRRNMVSLRIEEIISSNITYEATKIILSSVDGEGSGGSTIVGSGGGSFSLLDHNNIIGGLHLDTGERAQWDQAYTDRMKWDGGASELVAATGRTSLELGTAALLNASGLANDYLLVGKSISEFEGDSELQWNGTTFRIYSSTKRLTFYPESSTDVAKIYYYNEEGGYLDLALGSSALTVKANMHICINTTTDSGYNLNVSGSGYFSTTLNVGTDLDVDGTGNIAGVLTCQNDVGSASFVSGFAGSGWRLDYDTDYTLTVDNLYVRKAMNVYELIINQIRATNGSLWVTDAIKIDSVTAESDIFICSIDSDGGNITAPFVEDDIVRCQKWTGRGVKYYSAAVLSVDSDGQAFTLDVVDGSDEPEADDIVVRVGNSSSASDRQGSIYLTASDDDAPYIDVLDDVTSYDFSGKTKVRIGNLDGITDADFGSLSGYGLYSTDAYLKGGIYAGTGEIGGWVIAENTISSGYAYLCSEENTTDYDDTNMTEIGLGLYIKTGTTTTDKIDMLQVGQIYPAYALGGGTENISLTEFNDAGYGIFYGINITRYNSRPDGYRKILFRVSDEGGVCGGFLFDEEKFYYGDLELYHNFSSSDNLLSIDSSVSTGVSHGVVEIYNANSSYVTNVLILKQNVTAVDRNVMRIYSGSSGGTDEGGLTISYGTLAIVQGSDIRRKENIETIKNGLDIVNELNPALFHWKDYTKNPEDGSKIASFIAQEIETVLPNMVHEGDGGEKFINIDYIIPYIVSAIQELSNKLKCNQS